MNNFQIIFLALFLPTILSGCSEKNREGDARYEKNNAKPDTPGITVKTFPLDSLKSAWGYDIYMNGKLIVHQPHIPAIAGTKGFSSEEDARKTAALMALKIKNNIMPPTVSVKELDSLGILK